MISDDQNMSNLEEKSLRLVKLVSSDEQIKLDSLEQCSSKVSQMSEVSEPQEDSDSESVDSDSSLFQLIDQGKDFITLNVMI